MGHEGDIQRKKYSGDQPTQSRTISYGNLPPTVSHSFNAVTRRREIASLTLTSSKKIRSFVEYQRLLKMFMSFKWHIE